MENLKSKIILIILAVSLIGGLVACDNNTTVKGKIPIKEKTITEKEALDLISKTYESAYMQGAQDVLDRWIEREKSGNATMQSVKYFMDLKDKRLKSFLAGN